MHTGYKRKNFGVLKDDISWVAGQFERYVDFPFDQVSRDLGEPIEEQASEGEDAEQLAALLLWVWERPGDLLTARQRFKALAREAVTDPGESRAAIAFQRLIEWSSSKKGGLPDTTFRKFVALSATVNPMLVGGKTYADIASELHVTKAAVSAAARAFRDAFGFFHHEFRNREGRQHMRQARLSQRLPGATRATNRNFGKR
jgi:hypothetical protein